MMKIARYKVNPVVKAMRYAGENGAEVIGFVKKEFPEEVVVDDSHSRESSLLLVGEGQALTVIPGDWVIVEKSDKGSLPQLWSCPDSVYRSLFEELNQVSRK